MKLMRRFVAYSFNSLVKVDNTASVFHHFPKNPYQFFVALLKTTLSGYLIHSVEMLKYRKLLKNLKNLEGTKKGKIALLVANGPSCNKVNWQAVSQSQSRKELEILGLNDSILLSENSLVGLDYLLKSDPLDKSELFMNYKSLISRNPNNSETKLITPLNWHAPNSIICCKLSKCLHFFDSGRNHLRSGTSPVHMRTYPPMGSFKLLAVARFLGYDKIFVIGLDNTFFKNVNIDEEFRIVQGSIHYKSNYQNSHVMSHHFPNGIADYFHFVSQNFLTLRKYFNSDLYINLDRDSLNDTFKKIKDTDEEFNWISNS